MTDSAAGRGARHPRSSRRTAALGSAGMPPMPGEPIAVVVLDERGRREERPAR